MQNRVKVQVACRTKETFPVTRERADRCIVLTYVIDVDP